MPGSITEFKAVHFVLFESLLLLSQLVSDVAFSVDFSICAEDSPLGEIMTPRDLRASFGGRRCMVDTCAVSGFSTLIVPGLCLSVA